jgi:membrane protease YdiL (CAAX protease family)
VLGTKAPPKDQWGSQERGCLMSWVKRHPIVTFFVLTYAISWGFLPIEAVRFMAGGPLIAALIVIPLTQGWAGLRELGSRMIRWRVRWYWYVVAIGLPLAVVLLTAGLNVALGAGAPSLVHQFGSVATVLMVFAVRLVNPGDGALGEEPGWRGFALPGLQSTLSPLVSTLILAVLVTGWHVPILFLEEGGLQPPILVGYLLGTVAVTFWYSWLFNHTGGSVLITLVSHATQGTITIGALWSASADVAQATLLFSVVASVVAMGLVAFDWKAWCTPAATEMTTPPVMPPRESTPTAP